MDNAYRYLIAKRAATCEYEANEARFLANEWTQTAEFQSLQAAMVANNDTLYDVENRLVNDIVAGRL